MDEFKPDYDKRLRSKPFRRTNFTEEQMDRVVAMAEQRQRTGKGRGRAWLRYAAACTAMAAFVFVILFASGIVPTSLMHTAVGPSGTAENPAGNVYDPLKLNIGDKVASMTAAEVDVSRQGDSVVANILFESEALEISGSYAVVSAASDGDAEGGGLMVAFDPDVQSIGLFPSHNLFAHDIRLILTDAADIRQFGSIGQSGEAVIKIKGYRDRMVGKDDVVQNTTLVEVVSKTPLTGELEPPQDLPDASYSDFAIPASLLMPLRNLEDALTNPDAVYRLHEYQVTGSLENVEKWLRDETKRVGGTLIERYSYDAGLQPDFILKLPSKEGRRIVSTYAPKYENEQHLVVLESTFNTFVEFDENTEDHALVVTTPDMKGNTRETFLANYPHQHTDIYSIYFYSQAFFAQLEEVSAGLNLKYDVNSRDPDYTVGYFDEQGNELNYDDLNDANRDTVTFGIQLNTDFLPQNAAARNLLLRCWAITALMGDKAQSSAYEGDQKLNFLQNGKVFASYTISDLLKDP